MPELTPETFAALRDLVAQACGVYVADEKRGFLARRVARRMAELNLEDVVAYLDHIRDPERGRVELTHLVESIAVLETHFFRHVEQFELLEQEVLPGLMRERIQSGKRRFRAWSAGCATGEEAYSIAIAFAKVAGRARAWDVEILGTDLCGGFVERARQGRYPSTSFREVAPERLTDWIEPAGADFQVNDRLKSMVRFRTHNLIRDGFPFQVDVIFCRNVTIYFPREVATRVIAQLKQSLAVGGVLFMGSAETMTKNYERVETITNGAAAAYRRVA